MASNKKNKILIVNVNWIGDVLFTTPFIRAVREAYPDSHIACLVHPRCSQMLETNPRIDEIIIYDESGAHNSIFGKMALILLLRGRCFDTAFILHRSFTKAVMVYMAGIKERVGYPTKNRGGLLTKAVEEPEGELHKVEYFLNVAKACGIRAASASYEFFIEDTDRNFIRTFLEDNGIRTDDIIVTLCPGGNWNPKRWPKPNFARLADMLIDKKMVKIAISGGSNDRALCEEIADLMSHKAVVTCGHTSLRQLGALAERSRLVIANDTGAMHVAVSMKTNVIALFGPTSPKITGPYGEGNYTVISHSGSCDIPCYDFGCNDNKCMSAITVEEVFRAAERMIDKGAYGNR